MQPVDEQRISRELAERPEFIAACRTRDMAEVFRLVRKWNGLSNNAIGRMTGLGGNRVGELINGRRYEVKKIDLIEAISDGLGIPGILLGLAMRPWEASPEPGVGKSSVRDSDETLEYPNAVIESIARLGVLARRDVAGDLNLEATPEAWTQPMLLWMLARPDADISRLAGARRVGTGDVEAIRETTKMFLGLDFRYGGGHARAALVQYFAQDVVPLLEATYSDKVGRELYTASAEVSQLLGWTAYDLGRHGLAQRYFVQSLRLAQAAENRTVAARILSNLSHQANYLGRFQVAAQLARAAQEGAKSTASPAAMSLFLAMEARALAGAQDGRAVATVLAEAETSFQRSNPANEPAWVSYFDEAELAGEAAHCFRDLRSPGDTHRFVERAIELTGPNYVRTLAFVRLVQAAAYVQQQQPEKAADVMISVIENSSPLKSERVLRYLRDLATQLTPFASVPEVRDAIGRVRSYELVAT